MLDVAVVGMGLIGSAALRHAAVGGASAVGIGPPEPSDWPAHQGPFASHYDSGRITRRLDARREWAVLATRAIEQYPTIAAQSGIEFHRPCGLAFVRDDEPGLANLASVAASIGLPIDVGPVAEALADVPALSFPDRYTAVREAPPAGAIDPRLMIEAQHRAAKRAGALVARDTVIAIRPADGGYEVLTAAGRTHQARQVLIAAGAYANRLLPEPLAMSVRPEAVLLAEVADGDLGRLGSMPSIIYLLDHDELDDVYVVPPMRYPDGRHYVKIGGSNRRAAVLGDEPAMNQWMQQDHADGRLPPLREVLTALLPDVALSGWTTKPCLIGDTASGLPYIDRLDNGCTVAFGGNGHAAKSADAIGSLAAELALNDRWDDDELDRTAFIARLGVHQPSAGSRHGN